MRFKNCTIGYIKKLYSEKVKAATSNDTDKLENLKTNYPELFDAKFLMDVLKNEYEREKNKLDDDMVFKNYLFQYQ